MFGTDVVVVEADRLVLGEREDTLRTIVEPVERPGHRATIRALVLVESLQRREEQASLQAQGVGHGRDAIEPVTVLLELLFPLRAVDAERALDGLLARLETAEVQIRKARDI